MNFDECWRATSDFDVTNDFDVQRVESVEFDSKIEFERNWVKIAKRLVERYDRRIDVYIKIL